MAKNIKSPVRGLSKKYLADLRLLVIADQQWQAKIEAGLEVKYPVSWRVLGDIGKAGLSLMALNDRMQDKARARLSRKENAAELLETVRLGYLAAYDPKRYELIKIRHEISNLDARLSTVVHDEAESIRSSLRVLTAAVN